MKQREILKKLLAVFLALVTVLAIPLSATAINYEGNDGPSSGGTSSTTDGSYVLSYTDVQKLIVGYRFTGIKASGKAASTKGSFDVFMTNSQFVTYVGGKNAAKTKIERTDDDGIEMMMGRYSKKDYADAAANNTSLIDISSKAKDSNRYAFEWNLNFTSTLPRTNDELGDWQDIDSNLNVIAKKVGYSSLSGMSPGDKIIAEPIYWIAGLMGEEVFLTPSELAAFGKDKLGGTSTGWPSNASGNGAGTFGFIRRYANQNFPNSFFTPDGMGLWEGATSLSSPTNFNNILIRGYGVVIMYTDEQVLPDLYTESIKFYTGDGAECNPQALPLNKTIYVFATYGASLKGSTNANIFGLDKRADYTGATPAVTSMKVNTAASPSSLFHYQKYDNVTWNNYSSTTSNTRRKFPMANGSTYEVCLGTISSSFATSGYYHAAIFLQDKTTATGLETNTTNNRKSIFYQFKSGTLSRDVEIKSIIFKDENGNTYTSSTRSKIPFGSTVKVYHQYICNSKIGSSSVSEPYCLFLTGNNPSPQSMTKVYIDGELYHETDYLTSTVYVGSFEADSFKTVTRYGAIYLKGDYNYSASMETNKNNNKTYTTWAAKCDIEISKITLKNASGTVLGTYTRGGSNTVPTLPANTTIYVYYTYKNNSAKELVVNGHKSSAATTSNIASNATAITVPANGSTTIYSHSFNSGTTDGTVSGSVYVNKPTYGLTSISSSANYTGCETKSNNNTLSMAYNVQDLIDLEIVKIQYVYRDDSNVKHTLTVNRGTTTPVEIPYGVTVTVWYTFKNNSDKSIKIDGYYAYNRTGTPGSLMSSTTNADYNANGVTVAAGDTLLVTSGTFRATTLGEAYYYGAVFKDGKTDAIGEKDTTNNTMTAKYRVVGYDVAITDIYFKDAAGTEFSKGSDSAEMDYGKNYKIYYTIKNNSTSPIYVNVYNDIEPGNGIGVCVTPTAQATTGIRLEVGQSRDVYVGDWDAADQMIGVNPVGASVFLGTNTSATNFTYDGKTGTEVNTTNNVREEDVTLKFDVAITDIYFTTTDGTELKADSSGVITVPANVELIRYYVLKNNTNAPIDVNVYYEDTAIKHGPGNWVITLAAGEEKAVATGRLGYTISSTAESVTSTIVGRVYRAGQGIETDLYELTFDNNVYKVDVKAVKVPYLTAIAPNASYRVGTEVITSFYLHNPTSYAYTGVTTGKSLQVTFTVKDLDGTVLYTTTQNAIAPAKCEGTSYPSTYVSGKKGGAQLVFFKWTLPENYEKSMVVINAELNVPRLGLRTSNLINNRSVCSNEVMNTPDTQYEAKPPANWNTLVNASAPFSSGNNSRSWYVYTYTGGRFVRNYYYYSASAKYVYMNPISATTEYNGSYFLMRAGYGVKLTAYGIDVSKNATASMYTDMQYAYATWQEFGYSTKEGKITTLEKVGSQWQLPEYMDYTNADGTGKRIHFTPIWYPNRDYSAYVCFSDIWTPMGMITAARESNEIQIRDDMYEDWYIGHG